MRPQQPQQPPLQIPTPRDQHDTEQSIELMRQALKQRVNEINMQYAVQMAASGQMQEYVAGQMEQATHQNLQQEMELFSYGMPQTNVRIPQNVAAYKDWFASMEARQAASGAWQPGWPQVAQRYSQFQKLASDADMDRAVLKNAIDKAVPYYRGSPMATVEEAGAGFINQALGGYMHEPSRAEKVGQQVRDQIEKLVEARYPGAGQVQPGSTPTAQTNFGDPSQAPQQAPAPAAAEHYRQILRDEAFGMLSKQVKEGDFEPGAASKFLTGTAKMLGFIAPFTGATKVGRLGVAAAGETLGKIGIKATGTAAKVIEKLAPHAGDALGSMAYSGVAGLNEEQTSRIASLPKEQQLAATIAAHLENAGMGFALAPFGTVGGWVGSKLGGSLAKVMGSKGEGTIRGLLQGAGAGLTMPLANDATEVVKATLDLLPGYHDLVEKKLVSRPDLQTPFVRTLTAWANEDWEGVVKNFGAYLGAAAPGMAAFSFVHGLAGFDLAQREKRADQEAAIGAEMVGRQNLATEAAKAVEEAMPKAREEANKLAGGDKDVAEQLQQGLDRTEAKVSEEAQGAPTREQELEGAIGKEEATKSLGEAEAIAATSTEPPKAMQQTEGSSRKVVDVVDLRRQERMLTRQMERTDDPVAKANLKATRDDLRRRRREADVASGVAPREPTKPETLQEAKTRTVSEAAEAGDTPARERSRAQAMALRYEEAASSESLSPKEKAAAKTRAAEWTSYAKDVRAYERAGGKGPAPEPPTTASASVRRSRLRTEMTERQSAVSNEPAPVRERAAAARLAYEESPQKSVDEANASGVVEPGHVIEDLGGHKSTVQSVTRDEAVTRTPEGETEHVDLKEGKLPEDLRVVGKEQVPGVGEAGKPTQQKAQSLKEGEIAPRPKIDTENKAQFDAMHKDVEALEAAGMLRKISDLKRQPLAKDRIKTADAVVDYVHNAIDTGTIVSPEAREFLTFMADNAYSAPTAHGERYTAEMVYKWLRKKYGFSQDPRGAGGMTLLTHYVRTEFDQIKDQDLKAVLAGPWGAAARLHPEGKNLLRIIGERAGGPDLRVVGKEELEHQPAKPEGQGVGQQSEQTESRVERPVHQPVAFAPPDLARHQPILAEIAALKSTRGKATTERVKEYAKIAAEKLPLGSEERAFAEFIAKHGDIAASREGKRFSSEMLFNYLKQKTGWHDMPGEPTSVGEGARFVQNELARVAKEVRLTNNAEHYATWEANNSRMLDGPWAIAATHHPEGAKLLERIARMKAGDFGQSESGMVRIPDAWSGLPEDVEIAQRNLARSIWHWREDNMRSILNQFQEDPKTQAKMLDKLWQGYFRRPLKSMGWLYGDGVHSIAQMRADQDAFVHLFFNTKDGMLKDARKGSEMGKRVVELMRDPEGIDKAIEKAAAAGAGDVAKIATDVRNQLEKFRKAVMETDPIRKGLKDEIRKADRDIAAFGASKQAIEAREALGETLTKADKRRMKAIDREIGFTNSRKGAMSEALGQMDNWGLDDYLPHVPKVQIVAGGSRRNYFRAEPGVAITQFEAQRAVRAFFERPRTGKLAELGFLSDDLETIMNHYMHAAVVRVNRNRFLNGLNDRLYGSLERLSFRELAGGTKRTGQGVTFGKFDGATNLGLHNEGRTTVKLKSGKQIEVPIYEKSRGAPPEGTKQHVLIWTGDGPPPDRKALSNPKKVRYLLDDGGGLVALDKETASRTVRAYKGGLWEKMDQVMRGNTIRYIQRVIGGQDELGTEFPAVYKAFEKTARTLSRFYSMWALGGPANVHNAAANLISGTALNHFMGVSPSHIGTAIRLSAKLMTSGVGKPPPKISAEFNPEVFALHDTWAHLELPKTERYPFILVDSMRSGTVFNNSNAMQMAGKSLTQRQWETPTRPGQLLVAPERMPRLAALVKEGGKTAISEGKPGQQPTFQDLPEGGQQFTGWRDATLPEVLAHGVKQVGRMLGPVTRAAESAWWAPWNTGEVMIRWPAFIKGYTEAIDRGLSRDEALAHGQQMTNATNIVYNHAAFSPFLSSPVGSLLTNLSKWTWEMQGRLMALPWSTLIKLGAYNTALMAASASLMPQGYRFDSMKLFGGAARESLPGGQTLEDLAFGLGIKTKDDPQGLQFKGPLYSGTQALFGEHKLPIPIPFMANFQSPGVEMAKSLGNAFTAMMQGSGTEAAKQLYRAMGSLDPTRSAQMRALAKYLGIGGGGNIQEAQGTEVYRPSGSIKGSQVVQPGLPGFLMGMMPGQHLEDAVNQSEQQLRAAQNQLEQKRRREFSELGKQTQAQLLDSKGNVREVKDLSPAERAVYDKSKAEWKQMAKELGTPLTPEAMQAKSQEARYEATTDTRMRTALAAPTKEGKAEAIAELLEDPNYNLSQERWRELAKHAGGKSGLKDWLEDTDHPVSPGVRKRIAEGIAKRRRIWDLAPSGR